MTVYLPNKNVIADFDGNNKVNYANLPPDNQTVCWDNTKLGYAVGKLTGINNVAPAFSINITLATSTAGLVINYWDAQWKNVNPTIPQVSRLSTGTFYITQVNTTVSDEYNASLGITNNHVVTFRSPFGSIEDGPGFIAVKVTTPNTLTVKTYNSSGTLNDLAGFTINVMVGWV